MLDAIALSGEGARPLARAADPLGIKRRLVHLLAERLAAARMTRSAAARRLGLSTRKFANILYGHFDAVTEGQLLDFFVRLGFDVEIEVRRAADGRATGQVSLRLPEDGSDSS